MVTLTLTQYAFTHVSIETFAGQASAHRTNMDSATPDVWVRCYPRGCLLFGSAAKDYTYTVEFSCQFITLATNKTWPSKSHSQP